MIVVTHVDYGIPFRKNLIDDIEDICCRNGIQHIIPSRCEGLRDCMSDSNHYTPQGLQIVTDYIWDCCSSLEF